MDNGLKDLEAWLRAELPRTSEHRGGDAWDCRDAGWGADLFQGGGRQEELSCGGRVGRAELHLAPSNASDGFLWRVDLRLGGTLNDL